MNRSLIKNYNINFVNSIEQINNGPQRIVKYPNVQNKYLNLFLFEWSNAKEINEDLLPDIENAFSDVNYEESNASENISIMIYHDRVELYDDNGFVYQLPTQDFKDIVIGWRDFLLAIPLIGTKI